MTIGNVRKATGKENTDTKRNTNTKTNSNINTKSTDKKLRAEVTWLVKFLWCSRSLICL